jgi:hypothetical protein
MSTQAIVRSNNARTILDLPITPENPIWATVDAWAPGAGYKVVVGSSSANQRLYQRAAASWSRP